MRIHVFEFIGAGAMTGAGAPAPASLLREGDLMCAGLAADLAELPGLQVSYARDARLPPLEGSRAQALRRARAILRPAGTPHAVAYAREIEAAEAVWPIAPETGGALLQAAQAVLDGGRILIGPRPEAIRVAASKRATAQHLLGAGLPCVPGLQAGDPMPEAPGPWIVKPDDGAGCEDTRLWPQREAALKALARKGPGYIAQPWIEGEAMSLTVLGGHSLCGGAEVLSVNRQRLRLQSGAVELYALEVNVAPPAAGLQRLAAATVRALPGLCGLFGIDFVMTPAGPVVIEVNPRVTTACAALSEALGMNVAQRVLATAGLARAPAPPAGLQAAPARPVRLDLAPQAHG